MAGNGEARVGRPLAARSLTMCSDGHPQLEYGDGSLLRPPPRLADFCPCSQVSFVSQPMPGTSRLWTVS